MKSYLSAVVLALLLVACSGIPLRSMPRLMALQTELLQTNPAEFMLAIQVDSRMAPAAGAVPVMSLAIRPREPGAFETIERKLPMHLDIAPAAKLGLTPVAADRRWLIYSFPPESQAELSRIQTFFKNLRARDNGKNGGSIAVGISQENLAAHDPTLRETRWESWLQTSRKDGFFELWTGTLEKLLQQAKAPKNA